AVQFYESDRYVVDLITDFVAGGIATGESAMIIATREHAEAVKTQLAARGIDADREQVRGALAMLDARDTLDRFMDGDVPDSERFNATLGALVASTAESGRWSGLRA